MKTFYNHTTVIQHHRVILFRVVKKIIHSDLTFNLNRSSYRLGFASGCNTEVQWRWYFLEVDETRYIYGNEACYEPTQPISAVERDEASGWMETTLL